MYMYMYIVYSKVVQVVSLSLKTYRNPGCKCCNTSTSVLLVLVIVHSSNTV